MLRVVVTVMLAVAVLGASLPSLASVRVERADAAVHKELTTVRATVADILTRDDAVSEPGARRVLTIRLPERSMGSAEVVRVVLGAGPREDLLVWRVRGGEGRHLRVPGPVTHRGHPLELRQAGRHRLVFGLVPDGAGRTVTVRRFKAETATSESHARIRRDGFTGLSVRSGDRRRAPDRPELGLSRGRRAFRIACLPGDDRRHACRPHGDRRPHPKPRPGTDLRG